MLANAPDRHEGCVHQRQRNCNGYSDHSGEKPLKVSDVDDGLPPYRRIGRRGHRKFRRKDVEAFLASRRNKQDPAEPEKTI